MSQPDGGSKEVSPMADRSNGVSSQERKNVENCSRCRVPWPHRHIEGRNTNAIDPPEPPAGWSQVADGGPAFPVLRMTRSVDGHAHQDGPDGMSLRDHFAGVALGALVGPITFPQSVEDQLHKAGVRTEEFEAYAAHVAYGFADAMLRRRALPAQETFVEALFSSGLTPEQRAPLMLDLVEEYVGALPQVPHDQPSEREYAAGHLRMFANWLARGGRRG